MLCRFRLQTEYTIVSIDWLFILRGGTGRRRRENLWNTY